jgi:hypothetical protein
MTLEGSSSVTSLQPSCCLPWLKAHGIALACCLIIIAAAGTLLAKFPSTNAIKGVICGITAMLLLLIVAITHCKKSESSPTKQTIEGWLDKNGFTWNKELESWEKSFSIDEEPSNAIPSKLWQYSTATFNRTKTVYLRLTLDSLVTDGAEFS